MDWRAVWNDLQQITLVELVIFFLVAATSQSIMTWRWRIILKSQGYTVSYWRLWFYRMSGYGVSYITPTQVGGEPARIYLLNENHGIRLSQATASVLLDKLLELSAFVAFVSTGVIVCSFTTLIPHGTLYPLIGLLAAFVILISFIFKKVIDGSGFLTMIFRKLRLNRFKSLAIYEEKILRTEMVIADFLMQAKHKRSTLPFISFLSLLAWGCIVVEYFCLASFIGLDLGIYKSFLIATIPSISYLLPIPGGLGALEGSQLAMFSMLGQRASVAVAVVVLVRCKEIFFSAIGFGYALTHGLTLLGRRKEEVKAEKQLKKAQKDMIRYQRSLKKRQKKQLKILVKNTD
jgi:uncharacterized protein (TIRG00374 family)